MIARLTARLAALLAAFALAVPVAAADEGGRMARVLERGRLIVGVKADYPPWGMVAPDGSIVGLEADLARDAADRLGVELELQPVTAGNRLQRLEQGQVDLVIATMGDTAGRRQTSDLILPHYYTSGVGLLARTDLPFRDWGELRGRPVCLTEGAFFNRALIERYLIDPVIFPGNRDALLALRDGRCAGWAFDDTVIAQLLREPEWTGHRMAMPVILAVPWSVAVRRGEAEAALGRFASGMVADWHRSGLLVALQAEWGLPRSHFLETRAALWQSGACTEGPDGYPAACLGARNDDPVARAAMPAWAAQIEAATGLDPAPLLDPLNRARLLRGVGLTLALSLAAILGSLAVGMAVAAADRGVPSLRPVLRPLVAVGRMTPPLLQLYIVFFGLGGLMASRWGLTPGSFLVAAGVFSLYAGATNAVLLRAALAQLGCERPGVGTLGLMPAAVERCYAGLVATSVNIVKAAGLASTIALPEAISSVNTIIAEGADAATMMNLLLVFYFVLVLAVLGGLGALRRVLAWRR